MGSFWSPYFGHSSQINVIIEGHVKVGQRSVKKNWELLKFCWYWDGMVKIIQAEPQDVFYVSKPYWPNTRLCHSILSTDLLFSTFLEF